MIAMARIIVFPRTPNFFSFFILEKSYDTLDDFDHQASSEQEKESLKKLRFEQSCNYCYFRAWGGRIQLYFH